MKKILFFIGTRPEVIKVAPIIHEAIKQGFKAQVCTTGQHKEMLKPFLNFFDLKTGYTLEVMEKATGLASLTSHIIAGVEEILDQVKPDFVCVQGDTTTTFSCGLAAFYQKVPVIHIEAGLRTYDIYSPFPEEVNRQMVSAFASFNFCPTIDSENNLKSEKRKNTYVTGNTSIDALRMALEKLENQKISFDQSPEFNKINFEKKIILVTAHRRENHGAPLKEICTALKKIANSSDVEIVYPVHLNPQVKNLVETELREVKNIHLISPLPYDQFTWLMHKSFLILTDSGGVQAEAPFLKRPILVLRENTERPEVVKVGAAQIVGHNAELIYQETQKCLSDPKYYQSFQVEQNPYGDGHAAKKIIDVISGISS